MDIKWWEHHHKRVTAEKWTVNPLAAKRFKLNLCPSEHGGGLSRKPGIIRAGTNSGFQAIGMAILWGAEKIILLGYDMQLTDGQTHWHGDHKETGNPRADRFKAWIHQLALLAKQGPPPIYNATRQTALDCFPTIELAEALR